MSELPKYINCKNEEVEICYWYCHKECPETCAYALDVVGRLGDGNLEKQVWDSGNQPKTNREGGKNGK